MLCCKKSLVTRLIIKYSDRQDGQPGVLGIDKSSSRREIQHYFIHCINKAGFSEREDREISFIMSTEIRSR